MRDFEAAAKARHEVYDLIYRHTRAAGLVLAQPREAPAAVLAGQAPQAPVATPKGTALRLVEAAPVFRSLTDNEMATLADTMTRKTYRKGEVLAAQGAKLNCLVIIRTGVVEVSRREGDSDVELGRLSPGDYFGEAGLFTGTGEPGTARALTFVVAYEVGQAALAKLMHDRPSIADEISLTLSRRATIAAAVVGDSALVGPPSLSLLVSRIRQLFEVPHG